jgi:FkbM family methyltransferase
MLIGCWDTEHILPALAIIGRELRSSSPVARPLVFVDGGANIGKVTGIIFSLFANLPFRGFSYYSEAGLVVDRFTKGVTCPDRVDTLETVVVSVEAQVFNFERLLMNAKINNWNLDGFIPVNKALTNSSGEVVEFEHSCSSRIDEVSRIAIPEDAIPGYCRSKVETLSIPSLLDNLQAAEWRFQRGRDLVFLLKLDIEGQEPFVIRSMYEEILEKSVKFLTFEYITAWRTPGGLEEIIVDLWNSKFFCFLILPNQLVPVSGPYWNPLVQKHWTNFFCGSIDDPDLKRVFNIHNKVFDADWNSFLEESIDLTV